MSKDIFINKYELNQDLEDKFFRVATFDITQTLLLFDLNRQLFFDDYGNLAVQDPTSVIPFEFINPLLNKPLAYDLIKNKVSLEKRKKGVMNTIVPVILSPNLQWILYRVTYTTPRLHPETGDTIDPGTYSYLLYNFFHTAMYKKYYLTSAAAAGNAIDLFHDYCVKIDDTDPTCSCLPINRDLCALRVLPKSLIDNQKGTAAYNSFASMCQHVEKGCLSRTSYSDSFLKQYYEDNKPPSTVNLTVCAQSINAGGNVTLNQSSLEQQCSTSGDSSIGATIADGKLLDGTTGSDTEFKWSGVDKTVPPPTTGGTGNGGTSGGGGGTTGGTSGKTTRGFGYAENKTAYQVIAVVVVLALFGVGGWWYYKKKQNLPAATMTSPNPKV